MTRLSPQPMTQAATSSADTPTATVNRRSSIPEPWERPLLVELGELLRSARVAGDIAWPDLETVAGHRDSLRSIEAGAVRTRASRLRPWLVRLGIAPDPVLDRFAAVIAPDRADGRPRFVPITASPKAPAPRRLDPAPMAPHRLAALGAELWGIRVHARLSRPELAARIRCSRMTVWLVERGMRRPTEDLVDAWLAAVGVGEAQRTLLAIRFPSLISRRPAQFPSARRPQGIPGAHPRAEGPDKGVRS